MPARICSHLEPVPPSAFDAAPVCSHRPAPVDDDDGIVIAPRARLEACLDQAEQIERTEAAILAGIQGGTSLIEMEEYRLSPPQLDDARSRSAGVYLDNLLSDDPYRCVGGLRLLHHHFEGTHGINRKPIHQNAFGLAHQVAAGQGRLKFLPPVHRHHQPRGVGGEHGPDGFAFGIHG